MGPMGARKPVMSRTCQVKNCLKLDDLNEAEVVINILTNANVFPVWDMSCRSGCSASKAKAKAADGGLVQFLFGFFFFF